MAEVTDVTVKKRILMQLGIPFFALVGFVVAAIIFGTLYFAGQFGGPGGESAKSITTSISKSTEQFLDESQKSVEEGAGLLSSDTPSENEENALRNLLSSNRNLLVFGFFDEEGNQTYELHKSRAEASLLNEVFTRSTYTALAREQENGYLDILSTEAGGTYIIWAYPRKNSEGESIGTLVAGIDGALIKNTITSFSAISPARIQIVNSSTVAPLLSADTLLINDSSTGPSLQNIRTLFETNKTEYGFILDNGGQVEGHWKVISGTPWVVMAEFPGGELPANAQGIFVVAVIILVIFILLVFLYLYIVNKNVIIPLKKIEKAMHYFKTGDYSEPVKVKTKNEFIAIADQLNSMSKHIENNTSERVSQLKKVLSRQNTDTKLLIEKDVELRDKGQKLKELDQAKSMFVSVAAHQMRTPLAAIKWAVKLVMDGDVGPVNAEQKEYLGKGYESTTRMINLINDLLDVDKIESDKFTYVFREEQLEEIVQGIVDDLTPISKEKGVNLIYQKENATYPIISADKVKLTNSLQNLIDNAIKYTIGGGDVTVKLANDKDILKLSISDTGIGIPIAEQSKVFGKFFRAKNAVRQETDGSGLGLFIVKKIIEKHNGNASFESKEGKGTTFFVEIPSKDKGGVPISSNPNATSDNFRNAAKETLSDAPKEEETTPNAKSTPETTPIG